MKRLLILIYSMIFLLVPLASSARSGRRSHSRQSGFTCEISMQGDRGDPFTIVQYSLMRGRRGTYRLKSVIFRTYTNALRHGLVNVEGKVSRSLLASGLMCIGSGFQYSCGDNDFRSFVEDGGEYGPLVRLHLPGDEWHRAFKKKCWRL